MACGNGKIASREAAGEKKQGKERKICAIFCKIVQKVLDGWTYHVVSSYLPVKEGFLFARFFASGAQRENVRQGGKRSSRTGENQSNKEVPLMRVKITLRCNECKQRNYNTMKNKKNTPDKLELNKYCPFCRKHTVHTETK